MKLRVVPFLVCGILIATIAPSFAAIRPGDSLYVKVWNHPELSKQVTVDANGGIRVPLSGVINVEGLDEMAAGKKMAQALRSSVVYPAVSIETIDQGKSIFVAGGPGGVLKYEAGESLSSAIADLMQTAPSASQTFNAAGQSQSTTNDGSASALRSRIDLRRVKVQRDNGVLGTYDMVASGVTGETGPLLQPGDTIVFAYKPVRVLVNGDVLHPGEAYLSSDQSMSEAITQAGGLLPTSASNNIILKRGSDTRSLALGDPAFNEPAQSGDVITIPAAPRVNVVGTVVTPGVVSLRTDSSLLSAMYTAGGPAKQANLKSVQVIHGDQHKSYDVTALTHGDLSQNPVLHDGDTVVVPKSRGIDFADFFGILGGIAAGLASRIPL